MEKIEIGAGTDWLAFYEDLLAIERKECAEKYGEEWTDLQERLRTAKTGQIVLNVIEGGNEYMKVGGVSKCGYIPGFGIGIPIVVVQPNGSWYKGGTPKEIDWENGMFKTAQSVYTFHFVQE